MLSGCLGMKNGCAWQLDEGQKRYGKHVCKYVFLMLLPKMKDSATMAVTRLVNPSMPLWQTGEPESMEGAHAGALEKTRHKQAGSD